MGIRQERSEKILFEKLQIRIGISTKMNISYVKNAKRIRADADDPMGSTGFAGKRVSS